ncbi:MAG: SRPBCC family protein [Acidimicrobiia bacterium]|nr:SRPBCC family protein [Acidimicrobiia bacterium]
MAKIQVSIDIPRPPDVVWADVERLETHVEWMADAESIEFEGENRRGVGTTMRVLTKVGPLQTVDVIRVTGWDAPHSIAVSHEGLVTGEGEFTLNPIPAGTRFLWTEELTMPWYFGGPLGGLVAKPVLAWVWRRNLKRLAARFE